MRARHLVSIGGAHSNGVVSSLRFLDVVCMSRVDVFCSPAHWCTDLESGISNWDVSRKRTVPRGKPETKQLFAFAFRASLGPRTVRLVYS